MRLPIFVILAAFSTLALPAQADVAVSEACGKAARQATHQKYHHLFLTGEAQISGYFTSVSRHPRHSSVYVVEAVIANGTAATFEASLAHDCKGYFDVRRRR